MGGSDRYSKKWRRFGCAIVTTGALFLFLSPHWTFAIHLILLYAFLTTYHDYLNNGKENWLCWLVTGICYGLAALPLIWAGVSPYSILIRSVVLGVTTMLWSEWRDNAVEEELGRGALIMLTLPIL